MGSLRTIRREGRLDTKGVSESSEDWNCTFVHFLSFCTPAVDFASCVKVKFELRGPSGREDFFLSDNGAGKIIDSQQRFFMKIDYSQGRVTTYLNKDNPHTIDKFQVIWVS
jgi:hypothetical protein